MRNQSRLFLPLYVDSFGDPAGGVEKRTFAALLSYLDRRGHFDAALHLRGMMREGRAVVVTGHDLGLARGQPVSPEALRDYVEKRYLSDGKVSVFSLFTADALRWSEEWRSSVRFKLLVILSESQVVEVIGDLENSLKALRLMQIQA
jgi:hypothetical protein